MLRLTVTALILFIFFIISCKMTSLLQYDSLINEIHPYANPERPLENPKLFEGDILPVKGNISYNALVGEYRLWPQRVIPYEIDYSLHGYSGLIHRAIQEYHQKTCLRFRRRRNDRDYVKIFNGQGCYANVGKVGGGQPLSLGEGCRYYGTAVHELGHVVGFYHEHTRSDRDEHINLYLRNVDPQYYPQFQKLGRHENQLFNRFDYQSVMLYGSRSFSNNDQYSMTRKDGGILAEVHEKGGLSTADVERINKLYRCSGHQNEDSGINSGQTVLPLWPPVPVYPPQQPWGGGWGGWGNAEPFEAN
ncbi:zinc metalloproteinase nas-15-like [Tropilaelaps mercedesae]|uniref:Metalloendopeptidase n=1 Tax=Tropilaelaps mercedesae TaxID=418985 RepID=A0A1V9XSM7_9ACAR|nr:zinc metalloproteinase nas-15-like [Tropilaelaps mercedesae]